MASSSDDSSGSFEILTLTQTNSEVPAESRFTKVNQDLSTSEVELNSHQVAADVYTPDTSIATAYNAMELLSKAAVSANMPAHVASVAKSHDTLHKVSLLAKTPIEINGVKYYRAIEEVSDDIKIVRGVDFGPTHSAIAYDSPAAENVKTKVSAGQFMISLQKFIPYRSNTALTYNQTRSSRHISNWHHRTTSRTVLATLWTQKLLIFS